MPPKRHQAPFVVDREASKASIRWTHHTTTIRSRNGLKTKSFDAPLDGQISKSFESASLGDSMPTQNWYHVADCE